MSYFPLSLNEKEAIKEAHDACCSNPFATVNDILTSYVDLIKLITEDYSILENDHIILVNTNYLPSGITNISINLPSASGLNKKRYCIKKIDNSNNTIIILPKNEEKIDNYDNVIIELSQTCIEVISDNTNWHII